MWLQRDGGLDSSLQGISGRCLEAKHPRADPARSDDCSVESLAAGAESAGIERQKGGTWLYRSCQHRKGARRRGDALHLLGVDGGFRWLDELLHGWRFIGLGAIEGRIEEGCRGG